MDSSLPPSPPADIPVRRGSGLLRFFMWLFVILLVLRLFFPSLLAWVMLGPLVMGLPLVMMLLMGVGIVLAVFFSALGLLLVGMMMLAGLLIVSSLFGLHSPLVLLAIVLVFLILIYRRRQHESV